MNIFKKFPVAVLWMIFATLLVPAAADTAEARGAEALRVMSFNIRYNEPRDGVNAWPNRKQKVAGVIRFHKADLVGVQEALIGQLSDLETLLPGFGRCGVGRTDGRDGGEFSAILYRMDRLKLLDCGTFWLSPTPEVPGSMGWDAAYPRIVTWGKFRDNASKKTFVHFNTHFDHRGETARTESANLILAEARKIAAKLPYFLTGDLNTTEETAAYKTLAAELKDARYAASNPHFGGDSTFSGFAELIPGRRIDYVFVKPGTRVYEHGILSDRWNGLWASDHLPVLAEIEL